MVIVKTSGDNVLLYNVNTRAVDVLKKRGNYPQDASVDAGNQVVYWVNFDPFSSEHNIMRTSYANETTDLNITYSGTLEIAQDQHNLYVLDVSNETLHKYNKSTWEKVESINLPNRTRGIEVSFGK